MRWLHRHCHYNCRCPPLPQRWDRSPVPGAPRSYTTPLQRPPSRRGPSNAACCAQGYGDKTFVAASTPSFRLYSGHGVQRGPYPLRRGTRCVATESRTTKATRTPTSLKGTLEQAEADGKDGKFGRLRPVRGGRPSPGPVAGQWLTALEPEACQVGLRHLCGPCAGGLRVYGV